MNINIDIRLWDCIQRLKELSSWSVDLIVADPPYNLNKDYWNDSDSKSFEEYIDFTKARIKEAHRVLKPTWTIYIFMWFRFISYLYQILEKDNNMNFINRICWHYTQGSWKKNGFSARHDDILMFSKGKNYKFNLDLVRVPQKYYRSTNNMRWANPGDVREFSHIHYSQPNRQNHPTQKPEGLIERMVLASSDIWDLVVDPFAWSWTTPRVCQQLNRNCIWIELNDEYVNMIRKRIEEPFAWFDSIDPRMERIPNDINDESLRESYLENHIERFLSHHNSSIQKFHKEVSKKYKTKKRSQDTLF